jgi:hypothetical protein
MVIYLRHPVHGNKIAIAEAEAIYDEQNGWERYDVESTEPAAKQTPEFVNQLAKPRGRPRKELAA